MGRKRTMNYRELRADFDEEEERTDEEEGDEEDEDEDEDEEGDGEGEPKAEGEEGEEGEGDDEEAPPPKKKKAAAKAKPKRTRVVKTTRMRIVWGVYNNSHQLVATYDYPKKDEAEAHVARLIADKKSTHFVQPIKEPIEEKKEKEK